MVYVIQVCWQFVSRIGTELCVQWKTPDDGQRNCPKHVEFYSKNKFEKLVHLVGFIIRMRCLFAQWHCNRHDDSDYQIYPNGRQQFLPIYHQKLGGVNFIIARKIKCVFVGLCSGMWYSAFRTWWHTTHGRRSEGERCEWSGVASSLVLYVGTQSIQLLSADPHSSTASSRLNWRPPLI